MLLPRAMPAFGDFWVLPTHLQPQLCHLSIALLQVLPQPARLRLGQGAAAE